MPHPSMTAIVARRFGPPEMLVAESVDVPEPGPGQILIRVEAAAVNASDLIRRRDDTYPFPTALPFTPGSEVAGVVEARGAGVATPVEGTRVFALVGRDGSGGYAQYALAEAARAVPIPPGVDSDVAAGLLVAGTTAVLLLTEAARLSPGESVLVPAAAGGVGALAVQVARELGARGGTLAEGLGALAPFGRLVVYGMVSGRPGSLDAEVTGRLLYDPAPDQSITAFNLGLWFGLRPEACVAALTRIVGLVAAGRVTLPIGARMPLAEAAGAHRLMEARRASGKLVLKPWPAG